MGRQPKSLRNQLFVLPLLVSAIVLSLGGLALTLLLRAQTMQHIELRAVELARSIDSLALVSHDPVTLSHLVGQFGEMGGNAILVVDRTRKVVASSHMPWTGESLANLPDRDLAALAAGALDSGRFTSRGMAGGGRTAAVLPLVAPAPAVGPWGGDKIAPEWHRLSMAPDEAKCRATAFGGSARPCLEVGPLAPAEYGGAILVQYHPGGADGMPWQEPMAIAAALLGLCLVSTLISSWLCNRFYVLRPVAGFTDLVSRLRNDDKQARAPMCWVQEFDHLARQVNRLLDIRHQAEAHHRVLSLVLENLPVGIEITTADSYIEYANPAYQRMTGYSLFEVIGKTPDRLTGMDIADRTKWGNALVKLANGETWRGEVKGRRRDGSTIICDLALCPILDDMGHLHRVVSVRHDITRFREHEQELIAARVEAESADRAKSEFIANMSHELRTPLNSIIGFSGLIASEHLGPAGRQEYVEYAQFIEQSARVLLQIFNTILELSRTGSSRAGESEDPFDAAHSVEHIVERQREAIAQAGITCKVRNTCRDALLRGDEIAFRRIVSCLLSNAVKFNRPQGGRVTIKLWRRRDGGISVSVADNGIGIAPEHLGLVRKPFYQVDTSRNREHGGTGLGLTQADVLAKAHGAGLTIVSRKGRGTTVCVDFPASRSVPVARKARGARVAAGGESRAAA